MLSGGSDDSSVIQNKSPIQSLDMMYSFLYDCIHISGDGGGVVVL